MKRIFLVLLILLGAVLNVCKNETNKESNKDSIEPNLVTIVEIPINNFSRAVRFYESLLDIKIEEMNMDGLKLGMMPSTKNSVNVVLVKGEDYLPSKSGAVIYLNAGNDLQPTLDKVEKNGGKVLVPKTEITPEMGFFALFLDSEGNKLGLHSKN